jgi:hypothetical protein
MSDKEQLEAYAKAKIAAKRAEEEVARLYPAVLKMIIDKLDGQPKDSFANLEGYGKFSLVDISSWEYTPIVSELENELKARKAQEKADGQAKVEIVKTIKFIEAI